MSDDQLRDRLDESIAVVLNVSDKFVSDSRGPSHPWVLALANITVTLLHARALIPSATGDSDASSPAPSVHGFNTTTNAPSATGGCTGGGDCPATKHLHGCYRDDGNCDYPDHHDPAPSATGGDS